MADRNDDRSDMDDIRDMRDRRDDRGNNWWLPLLMIPVFFLAGWFANDWADTSTTGTAQENQQFGVGGGPETTVYPSATPSVDVNQQDGLSQ